MFVFFTRVHAVTSIRMVFKGNYCVCQIKDEMSASFFYYTYILRTLSFYECMKYILNITIALWNHMVSCKFYCITMLCYTSCPNKKLYIQSLRLKAIDETLETNLNWSIITIALV